MYIDRFISFLSFEKRFSEHTITAYQHEVDSFVDYLAAREIAVEDVGHRLIRGYLAELMEAGKSPVSVNRALSALRSYYKFLMREGLARQNPMALVKALKTPKKLPVVVEQNKLAALLDAVDGFADDFEGMRDKLVLELLFGTGIRLSELLQIEETHIDVYNRTILIFGKRNKQRLVPLNDTLLVLLQHYRNRKETQNFDNNSSRLIVTKEGRNAYPKLIYRIVNRYLNIISSQQKRSPHVLRHTFATSLLDNGADLNAIKELLGHANLGATQVYTHNSVERLKSIYKQAHPKA